MRINRTKVKVQALFMAQPSSSPMPHCPPSPVSQRPQPQPAWFSSKLLSALQLPSGPPFLHLKSPQPHHGTCFLRTSSTITTSIKTPILLGIHLGSWSLHPGFLLPLNTPSPQSFLPGSLGGSPDPLPVCSVPKCLWEVGQRGRG